MRACMEDDLSGHNNLSDNSTFSLVKAPLELDLLRCARKATTQLFAVMKRSKGKSPAKLLFGLMPGSYTFGLVVGLRC